MKTILKTTALLSVLLIMMSCNKAEDTNSSTLTTNEKYFKAKIEGVPFNGVVPEFGATKSGNTITIACVQGIHKFQLRITNIIGSGVGTYTIPATTSGTVILTYEDNVTTYTSGNCSTTGTLTINNITSNQISGTFSYNGKKSGTCPQPQKTITEGSFNAILAGS